MKSKHNSLNISLSIVIIIILIYFFYINYSHSTFIDGFKRRRMKIKKPSIKPKSIVSGTTNVANTAANTATNTAKTVASSASNLSGPIEKAVNSVKKQLMSEIKNVENRMQESMESSIKQTTQPINSSIGAIENKIGTIENKFGKMFSGIVSKINNIVKQINSILQKIIKGIKSGVVTPLVNVFKYIGLMFSQLGLLIFDFLLQIAQIPTCLISYIIWIIMTLKEQVIMAIIFPIIQKILNKIFGRFYPATIVGYFIKFLNWFINFHFYILSLIGSFFGITDLFYKEKCFNFTGNFKKRIDNMKKHLIDAGNSFTQFGKFDF
jgi:phage-related protein